MRFSSSDAEDSSFLLYDTMSLPSSSNVDPDFPELTVPHLISQSELTDLMRDLKLSEIQMALLASHQHVWKFLQQGVKVTYRNRQISLSSFVSKGGELVCFNDLEGLLQELGCTHNPEEWRLCVDFSKFCLKVVLLNNGYIHPLILIAHSVHMNETYENIGLLLKAVSYSKCGWQICGDLKVIGFLLGWQSGYTKFCLFSL